MLRVGTLVERFMCAGSLLLQWQGENFSHWQHLKFCHFQPVHCASKNLYLQRYSTDYRNLCLSSKMLRVGIGVECFNCAGILLLHWQGENFAHPQHLKVCHFQPLHCTSKNLIYPKVFNRFSKSLPLLEDYEGGHLGVKSQVRRYFIFAIARLKHCASKTFEILPLSTCSPSQQKSHISKGIQPIFEIFAWARRCWGWTFGWKVSAAQVFYFCNGKVKILRIDNIWNFATFNLYTVPAKTYITKGIHPVFEIFASAPKMLRVGIGWNISGAQVFYFCTGKAKTLRIDKIWNFATFNLYSVQAKILYLQRYSADFRNPCLSSTMLRVGIWVESFSCAGLLLLQWKGENFAHPQHLKVCHFQPLHCTSKNLIYPKVFNRFSKSLPLLEDYEGGHLGVKSQVRRYFIFAIARWKHCASKTFEILPLSTCSPSQQKSHISKGIQPIFEIFAWARRCWGWTFGWKVSAAQVFYFCNGKVKILRIDNIWNFATFNLYTVPAKTYITKGIHPVFEIFASARRCWGWALGGIFQVRRYFTFALARRKLCASTRFEILPLSTCTVCKQKSYISKGIQPIFEILAWARLCWGWAFGWKVSAAQVFYFCNGKVKTLRIDKIWNFATFNLYSAPGKILYLQRYSTDFRNLRLSSKILRVAISVESFRFAGILLLQWQGENFAHREHLKVCHFQPVHCASKNTISPRLFNRFSKSLAQFEDVEGGHWQGKLQVRWHFTFAMARWKLCASTIFEILPLSTWTLWQQKSYISKGIQPIFDIFASVRRCWGRA